MSQSLLSPWTVDPPLDGVTPVFEAMGADPSAGAGVDRPPGSIAYFGGNWYWKFGKLATNWLINPFNSGGGGGATVASWTIGTATPRYFAIDPTGGNDANAGSSDVSAAAAWLVAKKTFAGFAAIVPTVGAGRSFVLLNGPATMGEDLTLAMVSGYDTIHVVGTTDGSDSATDRLRSGAVTASAGPNGDGSWTCVAGGTTSDIKVAGGLPSETGATGVTLWRTRFKGNATGALANVCAGIQANTATDITPCALLGAAPAATDDFFIERPGVVYKTVTVGLQPARTVWFRGIASSDAGAWSTFSSATLILQTFCESRIDGSVNLGSCRQLSPQQAHTSIGASVVTSTLGVGFRSQGQLGISVVEFLSGNNTGSVVGQNHPTFQSSLTKIPALSFGQGCVWNGPLIAAQIGQGSAPRTADPRASNTSAQLGGTTTSFQPFRIFNAASVALDIECCTMLVLNGSVVQTSTVGDGVRVGGDGNQLVFQSIAGTQPAGGNATGFDLTTAHNSTIVLLSCTATGDGGDVELPGVAFISHAQLTRTNVIDTSGNNVQGTGGCIVGQCFSAVVSDSDGIVAGAPVKINPSTSAHVDNANQVTAANAKCVGIAVTGALQGGAIYYATSGAPFVLNNGGTIVLGEVAYLGPAPGAVSTVTATAPPSGAFQQRLGRWLGGTGGVSGNILFDPENIAVAVP